MDQEAKDYSITGFRRLLENRGIILEGIFAIDKDEVDEKGKNRVDMGVVCPHCKVTHKVCVGSRHEFTEMVMGLKFRLKDRLAKE